MNKSVLFSIAFLFWTTGATYWYVCKIKTNCEKKTEVVKAKIKPDSLNLASKKEVLSSDSLISKNKTSALDSLVQSYTTIFIYFDFAQSKSQINTNLQQKFTELAQYAQNYAIKILVSGNSDNKGSAKINKKISCKRAAFIKQALINNGLPDSIIKTQCNGFDVPIASNTTEAGRSKNRRVEISIVKK